MSKRVIKWPGIAIVLVLVLAACGGSSKAGTSSTSPVAAPPVVNTDPRVGWVELSGGGTFLSGSGIGPVTMRCDGDNLLYIMIANGVQSIAVAAESPRCVPPPSQGAPAAP